MHELLRRHTVSFKNAFSGLRWALQSQPNFRIHIFLSLLAVSGGIFFRISTTEMFIIVFTILLGLTGEMLNTCIEAMTDLITTEWHQNAKIAKDVAAGSMLLIAIGAFVIACIIFLPRIALLFS